jgi:hypothetical protein
MEVRALPSAFAEANQNITCYVVAGILKMLSGVGCEHLSELRKLAISSDSSILHDIPSGIGKIAGKLVKKWWTEQRLPYCMQRWEEDNQLSSTLKPSVV